MFAKDAKIYKDTFNLTDYIFRLTQKFRNDVKSSLGKRLEETVLDMADAIIEASLSEKPKRAEILGYRFAILCERFYFLVNLSVRRQQISFRQHAEISRMMEGIGKQATGWRKSAMRQ